jgi:hypothetical protein
MGFCITPKEYQIIGRKVRTKPFGEEGIIADMSGSQTLLFETETDPPQAFFGCLNDLGILWHFA